jgi:MSHA pilin protein MshC
VNRPSIRSARGFTLTELVVVIVIATIISAFAIARINTTSFEAEGFSNQLAATMRYAQKVAISQRRSVAVTITTSTVSLTYPGLSGTPPLRKPPGTEAYTISVPSGVNLTGTLVGTTVTFSALGAIATGGTLIVSGGDLSPVTITVETETGYVH